MDEVLEETPHCTCTCTPQEVMADLVLKWRECDADTARLLGVGKTLYTYLLHCMYNCMNLVD